MTVITSQGIPFGASKVDVGVSVAELVAAQDNSKGVPIIHTLQLRPAAGESIEVEFFDGSTSATILKTADDLDLENLDLFGDPGDSIRVKASGGTTSKVVATGNSLRVMPGYGQRLWKYATIADVLGGVYATLYDTPSTETVIIQRAIIAGATADQIQIGYADDAAGTNFVPVAIAAAEWLDQHLNFECPKGKKILLWGTDATGAAAYGLFSGVKK